MVVAAFVGATPLWSLWLVRPVLRSYGVECGRVERLGLQRLALHELKLQRGATRFTVRRLECLQPWAWLWRRLRGPGSEEASSPRLTLAGWRLEVNEAQAPAPAPPDGQAGSVVETWRDLQKRLPTLRAWLPAATLTDGTLRLRGFELTSGPVQWTSRGLTARLTSAKLGQAAHLQVALGAADQAELTLRVEPAAAQLHLQAVPRDGGLTLDGHITWRTNRAAVSARFGPDGWLPREAQLLAEDLRLPAAALRLDPYEDVRARMQLAWREGTFTAALEADAQPRAVAAELPPLAATLRADGDLTGCRIHSLEVHSPWLSAELTAPVAFDYRGKFTGEPAAVRVTAELSRQPWLPLAGRLTGSVQIDPRAVPQPRARFELVATELRGWGLDAPSLRLTGAFADRQLDVTAAQLRLADGSTATLLGRLDLDRQVVAASDLTFTGNVPATALPAGWSVRDVRLHVTATGPLTKLAHRAEVEMAQIGIPGQPAAALRALWEGQGLEGRVPLLEWRTADLAAHVQARMRGGADSWSAVLESVTILKGEAPAVALLAPAEVLVRRTPGPEPGAQRWRVEVAPWRSAGLAGRWQAGGFVEWPRAGDLQLQVADADLTWAEGLLPRALTAWRVNDLTLHAAWSNAAVQCSAAARGTVSLPHFPAVEFNFVAQGNDDGVRLEGVSLHSGGAPIASARGQLPVILRPPAGAAPAAWILLRPEADLNLRFQLAPDAPWLEALCRPAGLRVEGARVEGELSGSLQSPHGRLNARLAAVSRDGATLTARWPELRDLEIDLTLDAATARLKALRFEIEGQPVVVSGTLPLGEMVEAVRAARLPRPDWRDASLQVRLEQAPVAAFTNYLPAVLAPRGTIHVDAQLLPGLRAAGELTLEGAGTRGGLPFGAVQDLRARVRLAGDRAELTNVSARIGGEPVTLEGRVAWPQRVWPPEFDLRLRGTNVPLARQAGFILRSDVDLRVASRPQAPPKISGVLALRESIYVSDLRALLPGQASAPRRRPPYVSVDEPPFAACELDLAVQGRRFLKARTPLFRGELSADLRVDGTLREPRALGQVTVETGQIQFPFATVRIQQGQVFLSSENPYRPELFVTGEGHAFGYQLNLHAHGPADQPVLEFTSNPPLSTEAIFLLVTAGQVPRADVSHTQEQRAGRLATFVGRNLLWPIWGDAAAAERLTIRSGEAVTREGRETYAVEYKLTDRWSLVGEYDRFGELNAGVKWRVYSK